jgi:NAD(P)-dependent dehydrogenase (short-subunit alcohol dehydrogenase family)
MTMSTLDGKVALVTGAGRGIGAGIARLFADLGAQVVVNDLGGEWDGEGADPRAAQSVVDEIVAAGGKAVANHDSVADPDAATGMVRQAVEELGGLDIVVNNAGVLRDRMIFNLEAKDVQTVLDVHVVGTFNTMRAASSWWRQQAKAGDARPRRIINTSSASGVFGNAGQTTYGAAKAAIAAATQIASMELGRYGITVNAVCPTARTRLTLMGSPRVNDVEGAGWDPLDPDNVPPLLAFLASDASAEITGQVFGVFGGHVQRYEAWRPGAEIRSQGGAFEVEELAERWRELFPEGDTVFDAPGMASVRAEVNAALDAAGYGDPSMGS